MSGTYTTKMFPSDPTLIFRFLSLFRRSYRPFANGGMHLSTYRLGFLPDVKSYQRRTVITCVSPLSSSGCTANGSCKAQKVLEPPPAAALVVCQCHLLGGASYRGAVRGRECDDKPRCGGAASNVDSVASKFFET